MNDIVKIAVEVTVDVTPDRAWDFFTVESAVTQWNQASPDWHCPSAHIDLRVGGRHAARMEAKDGSFGFDYLGTYEEVNPPHSLTLRLEDRRLVRTTFEAFGTGTRVRTVFDAETANPADLQQQGWQSILDSYASFVERSK